MVVYGTGAHPAVFQSDDTTMTPDARSSRVWLQQEDLNFLLTNRVAATAC